MLQNDLSTNLSKHVARISMDSRPRLTRVSAQMDPQQILRSEQLLHNVYGTSVNFKSLVTSRDSYHTMTGSKCLVDSPVSIGILTQRS